MDKTHKAIAVWAPIEVAQMLQDYARKHGLRPSSAALLFITRGLNLPDPRTRPVGRPKNAAE